jgi:hypothetical protein
LLCRFSSYASPLGDSYFTADLRIFDLPGLSNPGITVRVARVFYSTCPPCASRWRRRVDVHPKQFALMTLFCKKSNISQNIY